MLAISSDRSAEFSPVSEEYLEVPAAAQRLALSKPEVRAMCRRYRLRVAEGRSGPQEPIDAVRAAQESRAPLHDELACKWTGRGNAMIYYVDSRQLSNVRVRGRIKGLHRSNPQRNKALEKLLLELDWKQQELAEAAEVRPEIISRLINGLSSYPLHKTRSKVVTALNQRIYQRNQDGKEHTFVTECDLWP